MMAIRLSNSLVVVCILVATASGREQELETRSFSLPKHGAIQLNVPNSWQSKVSQPPNNLPPTIMFTSESADSFQVMLTPIWAMKEGVVLPEPAEIKVRVEKTIEKIKPNSVEEEILVRELKGSSTNGYYFSATDKAPKPGEFKYLTQGMVRLGELLITFTILTNDGSDDVVEQSIAILKTAKHQVVEPQSTDGGSRSVRADAIQVVQREDNYVVTLPASRLTMSIPAAGLTRKTDGAASSKNHPRYFHFEDPSKHLIVSGWFEADKGYKGVEAFWANEVASWKKNGLPEPKDVSITKIGNWDVIAYNLATVPNIGNEHIRAHWKQSGTWIDVHLSITTAASDKDARKRLETLLRSISVTETK